MRRSHVVQAATSWVEVCHALHGSTGSVQVTVQNNLPGAQIASLVKTGN